MTSGAELTLPSTDAPIMRFRSMTGTIDCRRQAGTNAVGVLPMLTPAAVAAVEEHMTTAAGYFKDARDAN